MEVPELSRIPARPVSVMSCSAWMDLSDQPQPLISSRAYLTACWLIFWHIDLGRDFHHPHPTSPTSFGGWRPLILLWLTPYSSARACWLTPVSPPNLPHDIPQ